MDKNSFLNEIKECSTLKSAAMKIFGSSHWVYINKFKKMCDEYQYNWDEHVKQFEKHNYCLCCGKEISGKNRLNKKFCNSSCSAKYNNRGRKKSDETKKKISKTLQEKSPNFNDVYKKIRYKNIIHKNNSKKEYLCVNCGNIIENTYSSKQNKFCSYKCYCEYKHKLKYEQILNGDESIMRANYSPKNFKNDIINEQGGVCAICGQKQEWNNKPLVFILDHIDGNAANNRRDNLRCICPNCDSQLDTYKSKNKNGSRSYYRYHKYDENTKIGK